MQKSKSKVYLFRLASAIALFSLFLSVSYLKRNQTSEPSPGTALPSSGSDRERDSRTAVSVEITRTADLLPWERAVDEIIRTNENPDVIFSKLLQLVQKAPGPAQGIIARHLSNLATDENFAALIPLFKDQTLHPRFHVIVAAELLNRKNSIKLPGLLDIASSEWHPFQAKAMNFLCQLTHQDVGENWDQWRSIIHQILQQENPANGLK
jgi:hypothetical protein